MEDELPWENTSSGPTLVMQVTQVEEVHSWAGTVPGACPFAPLPVLNDTLGKGILQ